MSAVLLNQSISLVGSGELGLTHHLDAHVYLFSSGDEYALVDSGAGVEMDDLLANIHGVIGRSGTLRYVLLTHCHGDHAGGVARIHSEFPAAVILASEFEARLLAEGSEFELGLTQAKYAGTYPPDYIFRHTPGARAAGHQEIFELGSLCIQALYTPGHTKGSVCYLVQGDYPTLFSGDTVFWGGLIQLMNTPGSEMADYRASAQLLAALDAEALLPGHGLCVLRHARAHLEKMGEYFRRSGPPPMPAKVEKIVPRAAERKAV